MSGPSLSRDGIVEAALQLTRADGLHAVTLRAVAARFDVTPMALYRHVADREELVRLVADRIGTLVRPDPPAGAPWEERVRSWAVAQRDALRAHRGVATWLMENGPAGPEAYRLLELLVSALADAGFDDARVARGASLIMSWTFSRIAIEDNADARTRSNCRNRARDFVEGLADIDPAGHPIAARVGAEFFTLPMQEVFDLGLESIISGLRALGSPMASPSADSAARPEEVDRPR